MGKGKKDGVGILPKKEIKYRREQFGIENGSTEVYESWLNLIDSLKQKALDCLQLTPYEEMRLAIIIGDFQKAGILFHGMQAKGGLDAEMAASLFHEIGIYAMQDGDIQGAMWYFTHLGKMTPKTQKCSEFHFLGTTNLGTCNYFTGKIVEALDIWNQIISISKQEQTQSEIIKNCVITVEKNLKAAMNTIYNTPHKA